MAEPYLGDIRIFGFNFAPRGWAFCNGQILPIAQNQALYSLLGTTYGGDGRTTFALPDLRSRVPMHAGSGSGLTPRQPGQKFGSETVTLNSQQIPPHTHTAQAASANATAATAQGNLPAPVSPSFNVYGDPANLAAGRSGQVTGGGANGGHENMQPYLALNFCIAINGIFPSRN